MCVYVYVCVFGTSVCVCVCVSEQMFLIKRIVSRVRPWIMNSSSVSEKAAVEGTMGKLPSVAQRDDTAPVMGSATRRDGVKTRSEEIRWNNGSDFTLKISADQFVYSARGGGGGGCGSTSRARAKEHLWEREENTWRDVHTCARAGGTLGVVSMETKSGGEWRMLLSLLLPEWSKVWFLLLLHESWSKVSFTDSRLSLHCNATSPLKGTLRHFENQYTT